MLIIFCHGLAICDQFPFVDLRDAEICGAFAQIKAMQQISVVDHVMVNVANIESESEDEYFGTGTDGNLFGVMN